MGSPWGPSPACPPGPARPLPITAALLVRTSFSAFLLSWGLFKLFSFSLAPLSYAVGRALLEADALYGFWRTFTHLPVLTPMGYSRYLLLGGYVLALGLAVPTFLFARYLVAKYRRSFST